MAGNSIYWLLDGRRFGILKFDLCRQSLEAIELPSDAAFSRRWSQFLITPADDGGLNFIYLSGFSAQVWKWKANCDGGAGWMLGNGGFMLHLESMQFKKLPIRVSHKDVIHYPFTSFYSTGHIAEGAHPVSTLNTTGSTKRTISSVIRSERAASGV